MENLFRTTMAQLQAKIQEEGSIRSLAQRLDMNPTTISRWFAEQRSPDFQSLCIILEYFGARIVFPGAPSPMDDSKSDISSHTSNLSRQLVQAKKDVDELRRQIDAIRTERDISIGQAQALKEQIERLVPTEKENYGTSASGQTHGMSKRIVA